MTDIIGIDELPIPHVDGSFVSERVSRIVEIIRDYDSNLDVKWVPPAARTPGMAAFAITEKIGDKEVIAFHVQTEAEFDERVLERIFLHDGRKHNIQEQLEAKNAAARIVKEKKRLEALEEQLEVATAILKSPKSKYIGPNGKVYT
jgi:hypothetical protein